MTEDISHHCGVAYIRLMKDPSYYVNRYSDPNLLINLMYPLLLRQRNRGQDATGIATAFIPYTMRYEKEYLFVDKMISKDSVVDLYESLMRPNVDGKTVAEERRGNVMIGHVLYSTLLSDLQERFVHPIERKNTWPTKRIVIAMNDNFANNKEQRQFLRRLGQAPTSKSDMEALAESFGHFLSVAHQDGVARGLSIDEVSDSLDLTEIMNHVHKQLKGAYAITGIVGNGDSFFCRDPFGIRPLYYYQNEEFVIAASEMSAIYGSFANFNVQAKDIQELQPGHILIVKHDNRIELKPFAEKQQTRFCMFEAVYFNRLNNKNTYRTRKSLGTILAEKTREKIGELKDEIVTYVPHTAIGAALGIYQELVKIQQRDRIEKLQDSSIDKKQIPALFETRLTFEKTLTKDMKIRTFISKKKERNHLVLNAYDTVYDAAEAFKGKKIILVDDSIVRGTTLQKNVIQTLVKAAAKEIYIVSSCPQIRYPCPYGIEMSSFKEFISFRAVIGLIEERGYGHLLDDIEARARLQQQWIDEDFDFVPKNLVKEIYNFFDEEEVADRISEMLTPPDWEGKLQVIYPTVSMLRDSQERGMNLDTACLDGEYPEVGGLRVLNTALLHYFDNVEAKAYA